MTLLIPFALPATVGIALWLFRPSLAISRAVCITSASVILAASFALLLQTSQGDVPVLAFGGWRPPFGIAFAADRLSAVFVLLQAILLAVTLFSLRADQHGALSVLRAHPLILLLTSGLVGAFLTSDLFNLFVMFEAVLISSYLLLQVPGTRRSLAGAIPVIVINFVASALFLCSLGILYSLAGSVNLADLSERLVNTPSTLRRVALVMLVVAFATKAALVPLCFWMPGSYPTLAAPLAALFAGIMTKLGVYGLLRIQPLLTLEPSVLDSLIWLGGISALLGVLAAVSQYEMRRLLSFHSVSQVGYIVMALGLGDPLGLAAALFFALHHSLVKSSLYLVADELERRNLTRDLRKMDFRRTGGGLLAIYFGVAAFSLAGLPPLSGFFGKLSVFRGAFEAGQFAVLALLVCASVFTLVSMLKIWRFAFQRQPAEALTSPPPRVRPGPLGVMVALILALGFAAQPVYDFTLATAQENLHGTQYRTAILEAPGIGPMEGR